MALPSWPRAPDDENAHASGQGVGESGHHRPLLRVGELA